MTDLECSPYLLLPRRTIAEVEAQRRRRAGAKAARLLEKAADIERAIQVAYQRGALEPEVWPLKQERWDLLKRAGVQEL